jgi:hypothetical protein
MKILFVAAMSIYFCSCRIYSYYGSPMYGANSYVTQPVRSDTIKSAVYNNSSLNLLITNIGLQDQVFYFQDNLYQAWQLSRLSVYYGVGLTLGDYFVNQMHGLANEHLDLDTINKLAKNYFFGSAGFTSGINFIIPTTDGEWRALGAELSLQSEFGNYVSFRRELNEDSVNGLVKTKYFPTLGISTEFIFTPKNKPVVGWKISYHFALSHQYQPSAFKNGDYSASQYLSNVVHFTNKRWTTYIQFNAGSRLVSFHVGANYRLISKKKKRYNVKA